MMFVRNVLLAVVIGLLAGHLEISPSFAAGFRDFQDSWLLERGSIWILLGRESMTGEAVADETSIPQLSSESSYSCEVGQGRLFSMPELEQRHLGFRVGGGLLGQGFLLTGTWQILGGSLFRSSCQRLGLTWGRDWILGIHGGRQTQFMQSQLVAQQVETSVQLSRCLELPQESSLRWDLWLNLSRPRASMRVPGRRKFMKLTCYLPYCAMVFQLDRRGDDSPVPGFEFVWLTRSGLGLSLRVDPATGSLGPGILLRRGRLLLTTSHLVHPDLGQTHRLAVGFHG